MVSERGRDLIDNNDYEFCFHKFLKIKIEHWTCIKSNCKYFFKVTESGEVMESTYEHNQELSTPKDLNGQKLSNHTKYEVGLAVPTTTVEPAPLHCIAIVMNPV